MKTLYNVLNVQTILQEALEEIHQENPTLLNEKDSLCEAIVSKLANVYVKKQLPQPIFDKNTNQLITTKTSSVLFEIEKNTLNVYDTIYRLLDFSNLKRSTLDHEPDENAFVEAVKNIYWATNAYRVGTTLTNVRRFCENIHYNLKTPGAQKQDICLYHYSVTGGSGKTVISKKWVETLKELGYEAGSVKINERWIGSEFSRYLVSYQDEFFPPAKQNREGVISKLNPIVCNDPYEVEYKGKDSYFLQSITSLILNSNYQVFDSNTRRYATIDFNDIDLSRNKQKIYTDESSLTFWMKQALKSVPFGKFWEDPIKTVSSSLNDLIYMARDVVSDITDVKSFDLSSGTIREFAEKYCYATGSKLLPKTVALNVYQTLLENQLKPVQKVNGNLRYSKYNWQEISEMKTSETILNCELDKYDDPFEATLVSFDSYIIDETTDPTDPTDSTDSTDLIEGGTATATATATTDRIPFDLAAWEENMKKEILEESKKEIKIEPVTDVEAIKKLEKQFPDVPPVFYEPLEAEAKAEAKPETESNLEETLPEMLGDDYELQDVFSAIVADVEGHQTDVQKKVLDIRQKHEQNTLVTEKDIDDIRAFFGLENPKKEPEVKPEYNYPEGFDLNQKKLTKEDVEKFDIQVVSEATNKTGHLEPLATDQFLVAARLKDKSQGLIRKTELMEPVFFVYESDDLPIQEQQRILGPMRNIPSVFSMTYSGSKSIHTLVYIDPKDRDIVSQDFKFFWKEIGEELFGENAKHLDPACASIVRLTRLPGGFRYDTGKDQKCLHINRKCCGVDISKAKEIFRLNQLKKQEEEALREQQQKEAQKKLDDLKRAKVDVKMLESNPDSVEHLENVLKKTNDPRAEIASILLNGGDPGSGANYIGAIGYVRTAIGPETAELVRQAAHQLHPSNITKLA